MDNLLPREYMFYNIFLFLPTNLTIFFVFRLRRLPLRQTAVAVNPAGRVLSQFCISYFLGGETD